MRRLNISKILCSETNFNINSPINNKHIRIHRLSTPSSKLKSSIHFLKSNKNVAASKSNCNIQLTTNIPGNNEMSIAASESKQQQLCYTWGTSMMPTVMPAMRSSCRYSLQLYVRIHRTQGNRNSTHSNHVILLSLPAHPPHRAAAGNNAADDDDGRGLAGGCWNGITFTGLPPPPPPPLISVELAEAYDGVISIAGESGGGRVNSGIGANNGQRESRWRRRRFGEKRVRGGWGATSLSVGLSA